MLASGSAKRDNGNLGFLSVTGHGKTRDDPFVVVSLEGSVREDGQGGICRWRMGLKRQAVWRGPRRVENPKPCRSPARVIL